MINISQRPPEVADRAVQGHWDLIIGKRNLTAIGTLVERTTGYTMLLHLPDGYRPEQVRDALAAKIQTLPETLRGSLTWDRGPEMRDWQHVSVAADIEAAQPTSFGSPRAISASTSKYEFSLESPMTASAYLRSSSTELLSHRQNTEFLSLLG